MRAMVVEVGPEIEQLVFEICRRPEQRVIRITRCSGRRQISKTSCSISGPTSTTIARMPHGKGERRIRPCHDQSPISARFDGNHTVDPYTKHQPPPDL